MPLTQKDLASMLRSNNEMAAEAAKSAPMAGFGRKQLNQEAETKADADEQRQEKLKSFLGGVEAKTAGDRQAAENKANLDALQDPRLQDQVNQGGAARVGSVSVGADPYAHAAARGAQQASNFNKTAAGTYKPINDQLQASRSTLDALDQQNSASDKLALISEARLAAGAGGSRAIKGIMDSLSGGNTVGMDYQNAVNYMQNTPQNVVMQPGQRDAVRESVFNRLPQLEQTHQQAKAQLSQLGPATAPGADTGTIIKAYSDPAEANLTQLKQMQANYTKARATQQGQVSAPSSSNSAPSTFDRLKSFFGGGSQAAPPVQAQGGTPSGMSFQQFQAWKKSQAGQ